MECQADQFSTRFSHMCQELQTTGDHVTLSTAFGRLKTNEQRVQFAYKVPVVQKSTQVRKLFNGKSRDESANLRSEGNRCFQTGANQDALHRYTRSVLKAPEGSPEQALAFANRSAALFHLGMFNLSLRDIEEALTAGYPAGLTYKLLDRKARCFVQLARADEVAEAVDAAIEATRNSELSEAKIKKRTDELLQLVSVLPNESSDGESAYHSVIPKPNDCFGQTFIAASPAFAISCSEEKGRYAVATGDIDIGEVIVVEEPYAATLLEEFSETHCDHCMVRIVAPLPCGTCSGVGYCSHGCRDTAWSQYHRLECSYLGFIRASQFGLGHLALRMVLTAGLDTVLQCAEESCPKDTSTKAECKRNEIYRPDDYSAAFALVNHARKRSVSDLFRRTVMAVMLLRIVEESEFFNGDREVTQDDIFYVGGHILRHIMMLPCNAHEVSELALKPGHLADSRTVEIGSGLYNTLSLINHSCDPSVMRQSYGRRCVVRSIRCIPKGAEIADNYGALCAVSTRNERNNHLKSQYYFECRCEACVKDWPQYFDVPFETPIFKCRQCGGPVSAPDEDRAEGCKCGECGSLQDLGERLARLRRSSDSHREAIAQVLRGESLTDELPVLLGHLRLLETEVCRPWREYNDCQEAIKQIYNTRANCFSH